MNTKEKNAQGRPADLGGEKPLQNELQTQPSAASGTALAVVDFGEDAGKGMQSITEDERKVPFLQLIQSNSPELEEGGPKYLPNAKAGMFLNTATRQVYGKLTMVPCARDHKYIEYIPREAGSGFVAVHKPDADAVLMLRAKHGRFGALPHNVTRRNADGKALDGTEFVESFELYSIFINPETNESFRAILSFKSTQIGKYQGFIGRYDGIKYQDAAGNIIRPPLWAHRWVLASGVEKNKKGTFRGYSISLEAKKPDGSDDVPVKSLIKRDSELYKEAAKFNAFVEAGKAEVDYGTDAAPKPEEDIPEM